MQIVIVGAGYAGLTTALRLARFRLPGRIILINDKPNHQLVTQLHKVAAGAASPEHVLVPLKQLLSGTPIELIIGRVTAIVPDDNRIVVDDALPIAYDRLVVALGSQVETFGVPGVLKYAFHVQPLREALRLQHYVHELLRRAGENPDSLVRLVIVGGGLTGVELAGELADTLPQIAREHGVQWRRVTITIIEAGPRLLPGLAEFLSDESRALLARKGVAVETNTLVRAITPTGLITADASDPAQQRTVHADAVVWTAGVRGHELTARVFRTGPRGRALVDPFLRAVDYANVYILGDNALAVSKDPAAPVAPTAQNAVQQAHVVADNIAAEGAQFAAAPHSDATARGRKARNTRGMAEAACAARVNARVNARVRTTPPTPDLTPYVSKPLGLFVSVGRGEAVGELVFGDFWRPRLSGRSAYALKRASEVRYKLAIGAGLGPSRAAKTVDAAG